MKTHGRPKPGEPEGWLLWGKPDPNKEYLYRYMDTQTLYSGRTVIQIHCYAYEIIKRTEKGYWILMSDAYWPRGKDDPIPRDCQKFVLDVEDFLRVLERRKHRDGYAPSPPKRFAYIDLDHAWYSFKIRKNRQQEYVEDNLKRIQRVQKMIDKGDFESSYANKLYHEWDY